MNEGKRILIVRPDRIGDAVLSTAIPRELKKKYPDSFVGVLVRRYTGDIFINNPHVDKLIELDDDFLGGSGGWLDLIRYLRDYSFTHSLTLLPTEKLNYILWLAGIRMRIGVGHKFYQFLTNTKSVFRRNYIPLRHEADYCMDTARKIGLDSPDITPELYLSGDEKAAVLLKREELADGAKFLVGVNSTSGGSAPNWKVEDYRDLILELSKIDEISVTVTDLHPPNELLELDGVSFPAVDSKLRESIRIIAALDLLVSSSTGPMHIAAALKVRTVSLFCPLPACSPALWGPLGNKSVVVLPGDSYCSNLCPGDPKKCDFSGKEGIGIDRVVHEIKRMLNINS